VVRRRERFEGEDLLLLFYIQYLHNCYRNGIENDKVCRNDGKSQTKKCRIKKR